MMSIERHVLWTIIAARCSELAGSSGAVCIIFRITEACTCQESIVFNGPTVRNSSV